LFKQASRAHWRGSRFGMMTSAARSQFGRPGKWILYHSQRRASARVAAPLSEYASGFQERLITGNNVGWAEQSEAQRRRRLSLTSQAPVQPEPRHTSLAPGFCWASLRSAPTCPSPPACPRPPPKGGGLPIPLSGLQKLH